MSAYFATATHSVGADATEARLNELYGTVRLAGPAAGMTHERFGDDRFSIDRVGIRGGYDCTTELDEDVCVSLPTGGRGSWSVRRRSEAFTTSPVLFQPGPAFRTRIDDLETDVVTLQRRTLQDTARRLYGDEELLLRFDPDPRPVDARAGVAWAAALRFAMQAAQGGMRSDLVRSAVYRLLATTTLATFRLIDQPVERTRSATALLRIHQRAVDFIHEHASLPITVLDIARAAGATPAQLQSAFRAHSLNGRTALQSLRDVRLAAAHDDLIAADPSRGDTVRAVASRWGFADSGRFAGHYRARYGNNPRETLVR